MIDLVSVAIGFCWVTTLFMAVYVTHKITVQSFMKRPLVQLALGAEPIMAQIGGIYEFISQRRGLWSGRSNVGGGDVQISVNAEKEGEYAVSAGGTITHGTTIEGEEREANFVGNRFDDGEAWGRSASPKEGR